MSFSFSDLHPALRRSISGLGFTEPTEIQARAIPPALEGRDVLACAMTGSGKTAAFVVPIIERLMADRRRGTRALVLAPTRELAAQITDSFNELARYTKLRAAAVYGGAGMQPQERAIRRGVDLVVACPGRLLDHFSYPYATFKHLEVLVLDEADRMLDMGFLPDIRRILAHIGKHAGKLDQTLLFSATMPKPIVTLSRDLQREPLQIGIERKSMPAEGVRQSVIQVRQEHKQGLLLELLEQGEIYNALVFTRTKHRADRLARSLIKNGVRCDTIHGNRSQSQRARALAGFKSGKTRVLVATDVAARGIDVESLSHVINFDVPNQPEDYIHRVGRTARAGQTGEALTFVSVQETGDLHAIERAVDQRLPRRHVEGFRLTSSAQASARTATAAAPATERPRGPGRPAGSGPRRRRARPLAKGSKPKRRLRRGI